MDDTLTLEMAPVGRNGTATVTARLGAEVLAVESFNLTKPKARAGFVEAVCRGRKGIDPKAVEAVLLQKAADLAAKPDAPADPMGMPEVDSSRIVRPERFIAPEVSGLGVPTMTACGDRVSGRWLLYLRWADGRRECCPMPRILDLPGGGPLWIHPDPVEPGPTMQAGWSAESRKLWLRGEPAPDPANTFRALCERAAYFLDLPKAEGPGITATLALWTVLSYSFSAWPAVPYLYIGGPAGSGKSRVFEVLTRLVFRPLPTSNISAPALFRTLDASGGTCLLDEAERLKDTKSPEVSELLSALLAGYKRGGSATRLEPVGDKFRSVSFQVFGPKALACISGLPPALASRAIRVTMFRAAPGSPKPTRRIDADPAGWQALRDDLHTLALEYGPKFLELAGRNDVCPKMSGRDYELWQPLLALASWVEAAGAGGLLGLMQEHALRTIDTGRDDQTPDCDEVLLRLLAKAVLSGQWPEPGELLRQAQQDDPNTFRSWSARAVTSHLKRYDVPTPTKYGGRRVFREVTREHLQRIQDAYGIDLELSDC